MGEKQKQPWFKFYPADWDSDPNLRQVSLAGQGLWIRLVNLAHHADGFVLVNGQQPTTKILSTIIGRPEEEIISALKELENFGVFSRDKHGTIYSRRMVRGSKISDKNSGNGSKGGRPKSKKIKANSSLGFENETQLQNPTIKPNSESEEKSLYAEAEAEAEAYSEADNLKSPSTSLPAARAPDRSPQPPPPASPEPPLKSVDDLATILMSFRGENNFGMSRVAAVAKIEGWSKTLGQNVVQRGLNKAISKGYDRKKVVEKIDAWVADKAAENYRKSKETQALPATASQVQEDPIWIAVKDAIISEFPGSRGHLGNDFVQSVYVNDVGVKLTVGSRHGVDWIERNYASRMLELFKKQKPGIEKIEIAIGVK
jgi:hypothetical protein